jgi:mannose/fructose/N-acetylgalactosamine-specific phosphotransferase system component IID
MDSGSVTNMEMRQAFRDSGLWRQGWTFERAQQCGLVWQCLTMMVRARHKQAARSGQTVTVQIALI